MASPASASARPLSLPLTVPLPRYSSRALPAPSSRLLPSRRVALALARPGAALLSSLSDARQQQEGEEEEEEEKEEFYEEEEDEQQEYDDEEEEREYDDEDEELVEVGYVSGAHGVRGDVLVTPRTDFPELRFATPGTRWLRARAAGKQQVREFELVRGRAHTGKKCWIVSFDGIHNLDEARQIVGSAILVRTGDRPEIEDDEFYSLDLVGMRVIVKEWKDRKRLQRRVIAGKKVLSEMDQGHVLEGLLSGDKVQKASLAEQIGYMDFQLFRHAVHCISKQIESSSKKLLANTSLSREKVIKIPYKSINLGEKGEHAFSGELEKGLEILLKSKAAIVLVRNGSDSDAEFLSLLSSLSELMKAIENHVSPPFVIVSSPGHVESVRNCLIENDYFGLDTQKVWVLEELELPVVSISSNANRKKVLMKSPWEIIKRPAGSGGIFSLLSSSKILDSLNEMGVQYTQICSSSNRPAIGHPLVFGTVASRGADVGIKLSKTGEMEGDFDLVLSIDQLNKMCRDVTQLRFSAHPEQNTHVEHVDGQWVAVQPEADNSHRLHADVMSVLNSCAPDKLCVMEIIEQ
nr:unnamed protein product [Digitaria exilis]